jgi:uncharacterized phage infection (PIP) family protein YhgE
MTVNTLQSSSNISSMLEILADRASKSTSAASTSTDPTTTQRSDPAKWVSELDSLATSDPEKFKSATSSISSKLREMAKDASGDQAKALSDMADRFEQASKDGNTDALKPQGGPPPGPPPGGASGLVQRYASQQSRDHRA